MPTLKRKKKTHQQVHQKQNERCNRVIQNSPFKVHKSKVTKWPKKTLKY